MACEFWYVSDVQHIAEALIASNDDDRFRFGVLALAHALGANLPVRLTTVSSGRAALPDYERSGESGPPLKPDR